MNPPTPIPVHIPSETAPLKTMVMCLANPVSFLRDMKFGGFDVALLHQLRHNRFAVYDFERARQQQSAFMDVMKANGVDVLLANPIPYCGTQHYTRDIGFAIGDVFFSANPRRPYRQRELDGLSDLLPRFTKTARLENGSIEGGDVLVDGSRALVGLGEETNREGAACLEKKLSELNMAREVIVLEFSHRGIIHLDTKFNIAAPGVGLIHPKSFKPVSLRWLENHYDLLEATDAEAANMEINTFALSPQKVVMSKTSRRLAALLEGRGIEPILLDYSEVTKLPGSFRCTTLPIERADVIGH